MKASEKMAEAIASGKCPYCGRQIQATRVVNEWYSLVDGQWKYYDTDTVETRFYCSDDCNLNSFADKIKPLP